MEGKCGNDKHLKKTKRRNSFEQMKKGKCGKDKINNCKLECIQYKTEMQRYLLVFRGNIKIAIWWKYLAMQIFGSAGFEAV